MSDVPIQHAFVSYVREDADAVDQLVSVLQAASIPVWKDTENLWPGEDWQQKIREAIEDGSLAFIACFSTSSVQKVKTYMNLELHLAVEQIRLMKPGHVWLLPVRLDDCQLPPFNLGGSRTLDSLQRLDLFGPRREANLVKLVAAVMAIFGRSTATHSRSVGGKMDLSGNANRVLAILYDDTRAERTTFINLPRFNLLAAEMSGIERESGLAELAQFAYISQSDRSLQITRLGLRYVEEFPGGSRAMRDGA